MNFIEELERRGMKHAMMPGLEELLTEKKCVGYIGFDPTAPSMTIGNFTQFQILKLFQMHGHTPIVLMGGATGRIGDPAGKDKERELKSYEELDKNLAFQKKQAAKFLDFDNGDNKAVFVNNYDFYKEMNVLDFLRDVGKTITVSYMLAKDSVQTRLETGLSFTEFSYQLLQGYDFQCLYQKYNCLVQMGGSDQWGNITAGAEFIRKNLGGKAYALTTPLLTKSDGTKFGKSEAGNIWLDPKMTSPYKFYQFWINCDDADLPKFMRFFSLKPIEDIEQSEITHVGNPRELKRILAEEITVRVHSQEDFENVLKVSDILFGKADAETLKSMSPEQLETIAGEIPTAKIVLTELKNGVNICELLSDKTQILSSRGEARRAVLNNAVSVNKIKIVDANTIINSENLLHGKYIMVENGKKNKHFLEVS